MNCSSGAGRMRLPAWVVRMRWVLRLMPPNDNYIISKSAPQAERDAGPADCGAGALEGELSAAAAVGVELVLIVDHAKPAEQHPRLRPLLQRALEGIDATLPAEHIDAVQRQGRRCAGSEQRHDAGHGDTHCNFGCPHARSPRMHACCRTQVKRRDGLR